MLLSFLAPLAFAPFNKMIHLNYFWSVSPRGCVCFALSVLNGSRRPETAPKAGS